MILAPPIIHSPLVPDVVSLILDSLGFDDDSVVILDFVWGDQVFSRSFNDGCVDGGLLNYVASWGCCWRRWREGVVFTGGRMCWRVGIIQVEGLTAYYYKQFELLGSWIFSMSDSLEGVFGVNLDIFRQKWESTYRLVPTPDDYLPRHDQHSPQFQIYQRQSQYLLIINLMGLRILHLFQPIINLIPNIKQPMRQCSTKEKTLYTAITLFIYLLCCQIPLYGVLRAEGSDPFQWMRVILASNKGTLMELGMSPIISAGWILQLLIGTGIISLDLNTKQDKYLYDGSQKVLGLILAVGEGIAYIWSGAYGPVGEIGFAKALIILTQLTVSSVIVILLDEMLQKYGLGSGISLFIAANMCELIFWKCLSPITLKTEYGTEFEGALIALVHFLLTKPNKISALYQAFYRSSSPNVSNIIATLLVFFLVIYLQGFKIELEAISKKVRGYSTKIPIKLFYTSNISVIFQSALVSNLYFLSEMLHKRFRDNFIINLLGTWQDVDGGRSIPVGGFAYWISPPKSITDLFLEPLHSLVYILFAMLTCAFFSRFWLEISKQSPKDIAKKLRDQGMTIKGQQQSSIISILNKYIPTAAILGGMCIGLISIFADLLGAIGSGTGILLSVSILYGYYEKIVKDKKSTTGGEVL